jgi:hypothetical protein
MNLSLRDAIIALGSNGLNPRLRRELATIIIENIDRGFIQEISEEDLNTIRDFQQIINGQISEA